MKNGLKRLLAVLLCAALALSLTACGAKKETSTSPLSAKNPTTITIWNYYNGDQLAAFDQLVSEFNATVGVQQGIAVVSVSQGSINNLASGLLDAAAGKVGAQDLPTLAAIYAETAFILNQQNLLVNLDEYFTADELAAYVPGFVEEGRMTSGGALLLFPVSKSTECFTANKTDWQAFADATGITIESITSYEKLTAAAKAYYEYTDALTPDVPEDGKALYGRDSIANYLYVGAKQLGHELVSVTAEGTKLTLDRDTMKTLWDNYYVPYINGYFTAQATYRSEDMKTGAVLAITGSTSGVSYLPTAVTNENDEKHDIELVVANPLSFENGTAVTVQQGAGYCVIKSTPAQQYAAAEFLKWFTATERNLQFSVSSGYSPVTLEANNADTIRKNCAVTDGSVKETNMLNALLVSADVYLKEETYTNKPFDGSKEMRNVLGDALNNTATNDRAAVVAAIAQGQTREEAAAPYLTDAYFDAWLAELEAKLTEVIK